MKLTSTDLYKKIKEINNQVKENLRKKGLIVPFKNSLGDVIVGRFKIVKSKEGFFKIVDYGNEVIIDKINLPQTAVILANKLALGKFIDDQILSADRNYGHAFFEETIQKKIAIKCLQKKDLDRADLMFTKAHIAKSKKESSKSRIVLGYEKLMHMR